MADNLLETLTDLARRAGEITLRYFQSSALAIESKADESPVTIADRETEQFLRDEISRLFPGDAIVGEEFGDTPGSGAPDSRHWILDPIDGTKTFVHGVPLYGVMIGVEQAGQMIAGAVNIPATGDLVVAQQGKGCHWNGKPAQVSTTTSLAQALLLTTDIRNNFKYNKGEAWNRLAEQARLVRTWGDCYGHLLVATGRADIMVDPIMNPWDCAALVTIIEEAGGTFTDYAGNPAMQNADCAISTNGALLQEVLAITRGAS